MLIAPRTQSGGLPHYLHLLNLRSCSHQLRTQFACLDPPSWHCCCSSTDDPSALTMPWTVDLGSGILMTVTLLLVLAAVAAGGWSGCHWLDQCLRQWAAHGSNMRHARRCHSSVADLCKTRLRTGQGSDSPERNYKIVLDFRYLQATISRHSCHTPGTMCGPCKPPRL